MKIQLLVLSLFLGVGCAHSALSEKSPVTQDLSTYRTATIAVTVVPGVDNPDGYKSLLGTFLESSLKEKKLFVDVVPDGGDLTVRVNITKLDKPFKIAGVPTGESDAAVSVELFDAKANKALGSFDISADSKKDVRVRLDGVDTTTGDDPRNRAVRAASEAIATYIQKHRGALK